MVNNKQAIPDKLSDFSDLVRKYCKAYYLDLLGHKDWEKKAEAQIADAHYSSKIKFFEKFQGFEIPSGSKILVVGGGLGREQKCLLNKGMEVYSIEPDIDALIIARLRALNGYPDKAYNYQAVAEALPFPDNFFDYTVCFSVLEHVQDVEKSVNEMVRTVRVGGRLFVQNPNYNYPREAHYKRYLPILLPRFLLRLYLMYLRLPSYYITTLNFIRPFAFIKMLKKLPVSTLMIIHPVPETMGSKARFGLYRRFFGKLCMMQAKLSWIIIKESTTRNPEDGFGEAS